MSIPALELPVSQSQRSRRGLLVAAIALTLAAFAIRLAVLLRSSAPLGLDGYYYAVQLRSLLETGQLYYPAFPLAFWLLAPFAALFGPILGTKLGAALFAALAVPAVMLAVQAISRDPAYAALAGLIAATSPASLMLSAEFVKQGVGVTLALWMFALALRADERRDWIIVAILGAACLATHGTAAGLALLLLAPIVFTRSSGLPRLTIVLTIFSIAAALAFRYRSLIAELFEGAGRAGDAPIETRLAALSVLLVVAAAILHRSDGLGWTAALVGPAAFAIAINLPLVDKGAVTGIAPRLQLMAFVALALCVPPALHRLVRRRSGAIVAMIVIAPIALFAMWQSTRIHYEPPPDLSRELQALAGHFPDDALLIAQEHSTAFQAKWFTRIETVSDEPPVVDPSRTYRILGSGIPRRIKTELAAFESTMSPALPTPIRTSNERHHSLIIVPEPTWRAFLASLPNELRASVDPWPSRRLN